MTDKIQKARREAFESYFSRMANSHLIDAKSAWLGFNAALDCVVIELPEHEGGPVKSYGPLLYRDEVVDAIESTNLGIKVK